jgi:hypothetical protein
MAWEKMKAALLQYGQVHVMGVGVHLGFPVVLECGEGIFEEGTHEMTSIAPAEIEHRCSDRDSQFLDFLGGLVSIACLSGFAPSSRLLRRDNRWEGRWTVTIRER